MTSLDEILEELETQIKRQSVFTGAKVFQRPEAPEDEVPEIVALYLVPENPEAEESDFSMDLRIYPIAITVKFQMLGEGFHDEEDERHAWIQARHEFVDALMGLVSVWNRREDNTTHAYYCRLRSVVLNFNAPDEIKTADDRQGGHIHRSQIVIDFHTAEGQ